MTLQDTLRDLYNSELNFSISCLWDGGIDVKLGDEMNGFAAENNFGLDALDQIAPWMEREAIRLWPGSTFAKSRSA